MVEFIKHWVVNIVALVLFLVLFEILLPTGKMKKYVNLVTGTILIIAIITPITGLFGKGSDLSDFQVSNSNYLDRLQVEKDSKLLEKEQMKQIAEVYREKIIEQLEQKAEEVSGVRDAMADVIINEDYLSKNFGEIKRAYLEVVTDASVSSTAGSAGRKGEGSGEKGGNTANGHEDAVTGSQPEGEIAIDTEAGIRPVSGVKKVNIGDGTPQRTVSENCDPVIRKQLEERIGSVFGISGENIVITQVKR